MIDNREKKLTRLLTVISKWENDRKKRISKGENFKPPSIRAMLKEAGLNKNYFVDSKDRGDNEIDAAKKRIDELLKSGPVQSKAESKASEIIEKQETFAEVHNALLVQYDAAIRKIYDLESTIRQQDVVIKKLNKRLAEYQTYATATDSSDTSKNVSPFQVIEGDKDND